MAHGKRSVAAGISCLEPGIDALIIDYFEGDIDWMSSELKKQISKYSEKLTIKPEGRDDESPVRSSPLNKKSLPRYGKLCYLLEIYISAR